MDNTETCRNLEFHAKKKKNLGNKFDIHNIPMLRSNIDHKMRTLKFIY